MQEPLVLTDANLDTVLNGDKPVLILFTDGDGLRGDFRVAFNKAVGENPRYVFARLDPTKNPLAAQRFGVGDKPVLVGVYCGQEIVRRPRPWGTDLPLALEMVQKSVRDANGGELPADEETPTQAQKPAVIYDKPVAVTDATFEQEVLNSDLPVLIDFWAAWCGPCRMVAPILDKLAKEFAGKVKIAKVDVDANPSLSATFRIQSIPNLMIIKERTMIFNQPGALPESALRQLIQQAIDIKIPPQQTQPAQ